MRVLNVVGKLNKMGYLKIYRDLVFSNFVWVRNLIVLIWEWIKDDIMMI